MQAEKILLIYISLNEFADDCRNCRQILAKNNYQFHAVYQIHLLHQDAVVESEPECSDVTQQFFWYADESSLPFSMLLRKQSSTTLPIYYVLNSLATKQAIELSMIIKNFLRPVDKFFVYARDKQKLTEIRNLRNFSMQQSFPNTQPEEISQTTLALYPEKQMICVEEKYKLKLPLFQFVLYQLFVNNSLQRSDAISTLDYYNYFIPGGNHFPAWAWNEIIANYGKSVDRDWNRIQQEISKIKREFSRCCGSSVDLHWYCIQSIGPWGASRYGIKLDKSRIHIHSHKPF